MTSTEEPEILDDDTCLCGGTGYYGVGTGRNLRIVMCVCEKAKERPAPRPLNFPGG